MGAQVMPMLAPVALCSGCSACKAICSKNAIAMVPDKDGFLYPQINEMRCVQCDVCEKVCPVLYPGEKDVSPKAYAAYTKDEALRLVSSSGGMFTELAKPILAAGGVVFGCILQKPELVAIHAKAEMPEELAAMRGSKYVQSDIRDTYREARTELLKGRQVLFTGTPCQIAGLNKYLGKNFDNLLTAEVICHSVPSPKLYEKFKATLGNPGMIVFRSKTGQNNVFENSFYARAFFNRLCSRLSCHRCVFKEGRSGADMTIGDFWGVEKFRPELNGEKGVSLLVVHTAKAYDFVQGLMNIEKYPLSFDEAFAFNPYYLTPLPENGKARRWFMTHVYKMPPEKAVLRVMRGPWLFYMLKRSICFAKRMLRMLG